MEIKGYPLIGIDRPVVWLNNLLINSFEFKT